MQSNWDQEKDGIKCELYEFKDVGVIEAVHLEKVFPGFDWSYVLNL